ncbi:type IV pilin protein [Candidatus Pelagibacter sp. HIMB1517]|uniref:type IV pilin protein n=1 Tax=Candidatus Pelagibacter sp. HIMB1517 TaxID=3413341 RepID=UPI003F85C6BE
MKKNSGFSLVELLVVVAIIGVLAGVGIVGFQRYTETAKQKVALQNLDTVVDFFSTELIILNNNIQNQSALIKVGNAKWTKETHNLDSFLTGSAQYHDLGFGLANFKNPFENRTLKQVYSLSDPNDANDANLTLKGNIVFRVHPDYSTDGSKITGDRKFQVIYYKDDNQIDTPNIKNFTLR